MLLYKNKHLISKVRPAKKAQTVRMKIHLKMFFKGFFRRADRWGFCVNKACALGLSFLNLCGILYHIKYKKEAVWRPDLQTLQSLLEKEESVERLNQILHKYGSYIMGEWEYRTRGTWRKYHQYRN